MAKEPTIPHKAIVDFILDGHTTLDARDHFGFRSDNIANLRVHAAFKSLGIARPRYTDLRSCQYCGKTFTARDRYQKTCGADECQNALIRAWQGKHPESRRTALKKYRGTEKGRQNNLRMHRRRRQQGLAGSISERWNFAASEIKKSLRKLTYLATRNLWEYRLQHVQKVAQMHREFTPRARRSFTSDAPSVMWQEALRATQTTALQTTRAARNSMWENTVNKVAAALRTGHKVREWKRQQNTK